ncbi:MAG: hypothetical protein ACRELV_01480 [Longimicrobiales bacterium]
MAIRDLLWACPVCRTVDGLRPERDGERCVACGTAFRRASAARIRALRAGRRPEEHHAAVWAARIGGLALHRLPSGPGGRALRGPAVVREALDDAPIYAAGELLGWRERYGVAFDADLLLGADGFALRPANGAGPQRRWSLDEIGALGASSTSLQVKPRGGRVLKINLVESSLRLWEEGFQLLLRDRWRSTGRGEIIEFLPAITTR